jgi:hypothetical protein
MSSKKNDERSNLPARFDDDEDAGKQLLQGTIVRCVDGRWSDKEGSAFPPGTQLIVLGTAEAVQHWQGGLPIETILKKPGEKLPDVKKLNAAIPKSQWESDPRFDAPRPPWAHQYIAYLLNPHDASLFTYINSTWGAKLAVSRLSDRMQWMRKLRGTQAVPLVKLDSLPMTTQFGTKMRPEFVIVSWHELGDGDGSHQAPLQIERAAPVDLKPIKAVTRKEELDDEVPW